MTFYSKNEGIFVDACFKGDKNLVMAMITEKGINNWDRGMSHACWGGHKELAELMISKGVNNFDQGLVKSCLNGHKKLAELMIKNGASAWNQGLNAACYNSHKELALLMIGEGADLRECTIPMSDIDLEYLMKKDITFNTLFNYVLQDRLANIQQRLDHLHRIFINIHNDLGNLCSDY